MLCVTELIEYRSLLFDNFMHEIATCIEGTQVVRLTSRPYHFKHMKEFKIHKVGDRNVLCFAGLIEYRSLLSENLTCRTTTWIERLFSGLEQQGFPLKAILLFQTQKHCSITVLRNTKYVCHISFLTLLV